MSTLVSRAAGFACCSAFIWGCSGTPSPSVGEATGGLQAASPAIDHGTASSALTDIDGNRRPRGTTFDIGAYEFTQ